MKAVKILPSLVLFFLIFGFYEKTFAQKRKSITRKSNVAKPDVDSRTNNQNKPSAELLRRVEAFNFTWQIIRDNYFDQSFSGLDWDAVKKEFEPRVLKTVNDSQLHEILQEMISRLNRSHFAVIPPEVFKAIEEARAEVKAKEKQNEDTVEETGEEETFSSKDFDFTDYTAKYGIGADLRLMDNRFVVTRIDKNSAAEKAGMKIGYIVEKINDVSLTELIGKLEAYYRNVRNFKRYLPAQIVENMLNGEKESVVSLVCLTESDQPKEIKIPREKLKGETIDIGKNYPEQFLQFESAELNAEVGFIKFNLFAMPIIEKFCRALTELKDKKAIIIDLRGNSGGILGSMVGLSGMLTDKSIDLGTSIYKVGSENLIALSKTKNYKGRLVFLVDNQTISAAEMFSAALQENNRALIVGEKTAGEALPSVSVQLPTGAVLLYPIANFKTRNGNFLEGKGVEPNFIVSLDRKSLLSGNDAQLNTALKLIKENTAFPKLVAAPIEIPVKRPPPPPAPKPLSTTTPKVLGKVTILAAPPAPAKETINRRDEKALQVITDFTSLIGGEQAFSKLNSYTLKGTAELNVRGSKTELEINVYREKPDRYAEVMWSASTGEIKQVYNGNKSFVQADYGLTTDLNDKSNTAEVEIFAPLNNLLKPDLLKSYAYLGIFDRQGRKVHLIEIILNNNTPTALAFDVQTKLLVNYTRYYYGITFGDYRQVENVLLPFQIERENLMNIKLNEIKVNSAIEPAVFNKKENCFDKVD